MTREERLAALYKLKELKAQKMAQEEPDAPLDAYQERKSMGMLGGASGSSCAAFCAFNSFSL